MEMKDFKYGFALTGGIATGKSTVCKILKEHNFEIIDADKIAHFMLDLYSSQIALLFGDEFVKDGKVDRKAFGKIIFEDKKNRLKLEEFLHPLIREEIFMQCRIFEGKKKVYFVDIPLFFESGKYDLSNIVLVYAPNDIQLERVQKRDNLSKKEAQQRLDAQIPIEQKKDKSTYVIDNSSDLKHLKGEVQNFIKEIDANFKI